MSKKTKRKPAPAARSAAAKTKPEAPQTPLNAPWISMRNGLILVAIASVVMAVLTAWQAIPLKGTLNGILWGIFFGFLIWVIFLGNLLVNRWLRR